MTPVDRTELPQDSQLHSLVGPGDFLDCYTVTLDSALDGADRPAEALARQLLQSFPPWVRQLLALRDLAVAPFGLKTANSLRRPTGDGPATTGPATTGPLANRPLANRPLATGDFLSVFRVRSIAPQEVILGEDDRHLDFRISVFRQAGPPDRLSLATWVRTHNRLGAGYLRLIHPFHVLIVRSQLAAFADAQASRSGRGSN